MLDHLRTACRSLTLAAAAMGLSGCITIQAIEPVISPPGLFQVDATVPVEFVTPTLVGFRCAERGAKFLGLPGINSGACSDTVLMTMPDPCMTITAGAYARILCQEIATARASTRANDGMASLATIALADTDIASGPGSELFGAPGAPDQPRLIQAAYAAPRKQAAAPAAAIGPQADASPVQVEFVAPSQIAFRCAERGAKFVEGSIASACADAALITMANPCMTERGGWYARTLCHELAHVNGWPANHSGGSFKTQAPMLMASQSPQAIAFNAAMRASAASALSPSLAAPSLAATPLSESASSAPLAPIEAPLDVADIDPMLAAFIASDPEAADALQADALSPDFAQAADAASSADIPIDLVLSDMSPEPNPDTDLLLSRLSVRPFDAIAPDDFLTLASLAGRSAPAYDWAHLDWTDHDRTLSGAHPAAMAAHQAGFQAGFQAVIANDMAQAHTDDAKARRTDAALTLQAAMAPTNQRAWRMRPLPSDFRGSVDIAEIPDFNLPPA
jgi:hypothetical protein